MHVDVRPQQTWLPSDVSALPIRGRVLLALLTRMRSNATRQVCTDSPTLQRLLDWDRGTVARSLASLVSAGYVRKDVMLSGADGREFRWRLTIRPTDPRNRIVLDNAAIWTDGRTALSRPQQQGLLFAIAVISQMDHGDRDDDRQMGSTWIAKRSGLSRATFLRYRDVALGRGAEQGVLPPGYITVDYGTRGESNVPGRDVWSLDRKVAHELQKVIDAQPVDPAEAEQGALFEDEVAEDRSAGDPVSNVIALPVAATLESAPAAETDPVEITDPDVALVAWCAAGALAADQNSVLRTDARPTGPIAPTGAQRKAAADLLARYDRSTVMGALCVAMVAERPFHRNQMSRRGLSHLSDITIMGELSGDRHANDISMAVLETWRRTGPTNENWYAAWQDVVSSRSAIIDHVRSAAAPAPASGREAAVMIGQKSPTTEAHRRVSAASSV